MPSLFRPVRQHALKDLDVSIEWVAVVSEKMKFDIVRLHIDSFLDLYAPYTESMLGLKSGLTKEVFLRNMIVESLEEVESKALDLVVIRLSEHIAGFAICTPTSVTIEKAAVYINLLAVKPFKYLNVNEHLRIGLGGHIIDSIVTHYENARYINLDTRIINTGAISFYQKLGFTCQANTISPDADATHYLGVERYVPKPGYLSP